MVNSKQKPGITRPRFAQSFSRRGSVFGVHRSSSFIASQSDGKQARRFSVQLFIPPTEQGIALTGGVNITKEGFLQARFEEGIALLNGFKTKYVVLEKGAFKVYNQNEMLKPGVAQDIDIAEAETEVSLVDIRGIEYLDMDSKSFSLLVGSEKNKNSNKTDYVEKVLSFKANTSEEAVDWIQHLLVELKNHAKFLDASAGVMMNRTALDEDVEEVLRECVDLWTLAVGKINENTVQAQRRLATWLLRDSSGDRGEDAEYWQAVADKGEEELKARGERDLTDPVETVVSPIDEIRQDIELYGLVKDKQEN